MKSTLKSYLDKSCIIFNKHRKKSHNIIPLPGTLDPIQDNKRHLEAAITEAESTEEFADFAKKLGVGPLGPYLEELTKKEERRREKQQGKPKDTDKLKRDTEIYAAKAFLRNTGTYLKIWQGISIKEKDLEDLVAILERRSHESKVIRLFVFDGFIPCHGRKNLDSISLPVGELKKYTKEELDNLLLLPQSSWHGIVDPEITQKAAIWHILTVRESSEYSGIPGVWIDGHLALIIDLNDLYFKRSESDIEIIGPLFLCIGEDANLAIEICVRTNIFEYFSVRQRVRNDYLPWDNFDEEGEPKARTFCKEMGDNGDKLRKVYEIWRNINTLDTDGFLKYPTETYVRSVMNLHTFWKGLMEVFVGFVTVIESLLTPGTRQELAYKMAVRGAALLSPDPLHRIGLFKILDEFYKTRSQIVHEGRTDEGDLYDLKNNISPNLTTISRQIFLRYIFLLNMGLNKELPDRIVPGPEKLKARNSRAKTIANILDGLVFDPDLTVSLEGKMKNWGVFEDWIRMTTLHFKN
jgi:hypothetical protein